MGAPNKIRIDDLADPVLTDVQKAGLAFGELRGQTFGWTESHTTAGWTIGAGAEVGLASNWSVKLEYLYIDLSTSQFAITGVSNGYSASVVRAGVNYRF